MRKPKDIIADLENEIKSSGVNIKLMKMNACNYESMKSLLSSDEFQNIKVKTFIHSLAFGSMKPFISKNESKRLNKKITG